MDPWFDIAPMLPEWTSAAENHWWSIIVAFIALVAIPIGVTVGFRVAVAAFRGLAGLFIAYRGGVREGREAVAHRMGQRAGAASGYMDVLGSSWYDGPGMTVEDVEAIEERAAWGGIPVSDRVAASGYASDRALRAVEEEEDYA